jgi:hypothetical protein
VPLIRGGGVGRFGSLVESIGGGALALVVCLSRGSGVLGLIVLAARPARSKDLEILVLSTSWPCSGAGRPGRG